MTKTCGICGHAALDDQAQFCNRCGAAVPKEKKPAFPVCPACGSVVSDELAQYCNRCGAKILQVAVVCETCGSPAIDNQSRFCTRCGTTFEQKPLFRSTTCPSCGAPDSDGQSVYCDRCGSPFDRKGMQAAPRQSPAPVIVTQRKQAVHPTVAAAPESSWEPWNEEPLAPVHQEPPASAMPEPPAHHDLQINVPKKRYSHIPLVAEELKKGDPAEPRKKREGTQKKGVLGLMKK